MSRNRYRYLYLLFSCFTKVSIAFSGFGQFFLTVSRIFLYSWFGLVFCWHQNKWIRCFLGLRHFFDEILFNFFCQVRAVTLVAPFSGAPPNGPSPASGAGAAKATVLSHPVARAAFPAGYANVSRYVVKIKSAPEFEYRVRYWSVVVF
jgi:hypothetical protein